MSSNTQSERKILHLNDTNAYHRERGDIVEYHMPIVLTINPNDMVDPDNERWLLYKNWLQRMIDSDYDTQNEIYNYITQTLRAANYFLNACHNENTLWKFGEYNGTSDYKYFTFQGPLFNVLYDMAIAIDQNRIYNPRHLQLFLIEICEYEDESLTDENFVNIIKRFIINDSFWLYPV